MARRRTEKNKLKDEETSPASGTRRRRRKSKSISEGRSGSWRVRLAMVAIAFLALVYFLPAIIANTPLKQWAINTALGEFRGKVTIDTMSLGWFAPVELTGLHVVDLEGEEIVSAAHVRFSRTLAGLINTANFGTITVLQPEASLSVRVDGSNIEDAVAPWLAVPADPDARPLQLQIVIEDGRAQVHDVATGAVCQVLQLGGTIDLPGESAPLELDIQGVVSGSSIGNRDASGRFDAQVRFDPGDNAIALAAGRVALNANALPVDIASPFLRRFVEPMETTGRMDGKLEILWSGYGNQFSVNAFPARLTAVAITAPRRIGNDRMVIEDAWLQGQIGVSPQALATTDLLCRTDFGSIKANGAISWEQLGAVAGARIPGSDFQADGSLDIARLAAMLPDTIPLHSDVVIESGTIQFNANSHAEGADRRLVLNIESAGLSALRAGQRIDWHKPVRLVAAIRQGAAGTQFESLECTTNFLSLKGQASAEAGEFTASGDLQAALAEASRFIDFGGMELAGKIDGKFAWQFDGAGLDPLANRPLRVGGNFRIDQPLVDLPGQTRWSEQEINIVVQAAGQMLPAADGSRSVRIDTGHLELVNAQQTLQATLAAPLLNPSLSTPIQLECKMGGEIETWLAQARTWLTIDAAASGNIDSTASVSINGGQIEVRNGICALRELDFRGYGLNIVEDQVDAHANIDIDMENGKVTLPEVTMRSSTVAARGDNLLFDLSTGSGSMSGQLAFRADVNRAMAWLGKPAAESVQYFGAAEGTVLMSTSGNAIEGTVDIRINDLIAARPTRVPSTMQNVSAGKVNWVHLLEEKQVSLRSRLQLDRAFEKASFENLELASSAFNLRASGSVADPAAQMVTDIRGTWSPNWALLQPLVQSYTGSLLSIDQVTGGEFTLRGPIGNAPGTVRTAIVNPALQLQTEAAFASGTLLGLPIGGSRIQVALADSVARFQCQPIAFSGGTLDLSPSLDLRGPSPIANVPAGTIVNTVQLTPEICRGWLRFVAPVIADATAASGKFSLRTDGIRIPLDAIDTTSMNGAIVLHGANVGPGPLGQQLMNTARQLKALAAGASLESLLASPVAATGKSWVTMPEQTIPFAVQQGRVFHQDLMFQIDDVVVRTRGSVGLDQSMQLMAEVPVLDKWIGNNRLLAGLRGQSLQLPIAGTVSQPRVDNAAVANLSQQLLTGAAGNLINEQMQGLIDKGNQRIESELKDGLGRLLGPKK